MTTADRPSLRHKETTAFNQRGAAAAFKARQKLNVRKRSNRLKHSTKLEKRRQEQKRDTPAKRRHPKANRNKTRAVGRATGGKALPKRERAYSEKARGNSKSINNGNSDARRNVLQQQQWQQRLDRKTARPTTMTPTTENSNFKKNPVLFRQKSGPFS